MRVLLIDDEDDVRRIACASLSRLGGMEVVDAASGDEALDIARAFRPDAVLLDVQMPGLDGPATLAALRAIDGLEMTPIVFVTAYSSPSDIERLLECGACAVITKPFDPIDLPNELCRVIASVTCDSARE